MTDSLNILLVDDSPQDRGLARRELIKEFPNAVFVEVTNDDEFESALAVNQFDVVVTDFEIRWTNGLAVLKTVKQRTPNCPVVMFTATGTEEIAVDAMKNGLDDYIIKNVHHMVRLGAAVRSALEHQVARSRSERLELRLGNLLRNLKVGVFQRRTDGTITEANEAAATILGFANVQELVGQQLPRLLLASADGFTSFHSTPSLAINAECVLARNGETVWVSVVEQSVSGSDAIYDGMIEDVTARRRAEEQLNQVRNEMAHVARINTMAAMASGISHELNQPLSSIANFAGAGSLLLQEPIVSNIKRIGEYLTQIHDLALSSAQIIKGLRDFTKRGGESRRDLVRVSDLLTRCVTMMQFEIREAGVDLHVDMPPDDVHVRADGIQIQQVLVNLVNNALAAMSQTEQRHRKLTMKVERQPDSILIHVVDTGTGIADELLNRLFEPSVSTYTDGTGMGLCISLKIVEAHRGRLDAWNNDQSGATFRLSLPLQIE